MRKYLLTNFKVNASYYVYIGGNVDGADTAGVYDVAGIGNYEDGVQQAFTGTDVMRRPMGGFNGDFGGGFPGERPEGAGGRPDGAKGRPDKAGGSPERPGGFGGKEGFGGPRRDAANDIFYMQDKVNFFSGVTAMQKSKDISV